MTGAATSARAAGTIFVALALAAAAVALFFGYYGARLIYLAASFGEQGPIDRGVPIIFGILSYLSVVTAAILFPFVTLAAAALSWLSLKAAQRRIH